MFTLPQATERAWPVESESLDPFDSAVNDVSVKKRREKEITGTTATANLNFIS